MSNNSTSPPPDLIRTIEQDDLDSFLEGMDRVRRSIAGIAEAVNMTDPGRLHAKSIDLLDHSNVACGLSSILWACANEIRIDLEQFRRRFSPIPQGQVKTAEPVPLAKRAGPVIEFSAVTK